MMEIKIIIILQIIQSFSIFSRNMPQNLSDCREVLTKPPECGSHAVNSLAAVHFH